MSLSIRILIAASTHNHHSDSLQRADHITVQAIQPLDRCSCQDPRASAGTSRLSDQDLNDRLNTTRDTDDTNNTRSTRVQDDRCRSNTRVKQRKRDRIGIVLRKMLPGAGFLAGVAVVGERIWEVVENAS